MRGFDGYVSPSLEQGWLPELAFLGSRQEMGIMVKWCQEKTEIWGLDSISRSAEPQRDIFLDLYW